MNPRLDENYPHDPLEAATFWCVRLFDGDMSETEWAVFDTWHAQPENAQQLQKTIAVWQLCNDVAKQPEIIPLRTAALSEYYNANRSRWSVGRFAAGRWSRGIAAAAMVVATGAWLFITPHDDILETGVGERRVAALADKSTISLDSLTEVDVRLDDNSREIELRRGRAKFDVTRDPLRPFRVNVGDKTIVAIGTSFSAELVGTEVRVILYEGKVEVRDRSDLASWPAAGGTRLLLTPGQELIEEVNSATPARIVKTDEMQSLVWQHGMISFEGEKLARAAERMNRYSERKIRLGDAGVAQIIVDGEFEAGNLEAFVEAVAALNDLKTTNRAKEIVLSRK